MEAFVSLGQICIRLVLLRKLWREWNSPVYWYYQRTSAQAVSGHLIPMSPNKLKPPCLEMWLSEAFAW